MLLFTRRPDRFLVPQFHADDAIFFQQAVESGWSSLLRPHGGYLQLAERLVACSVNSARLPWEWVPLAYNLAAGLVTVLVALRLAEVAPTRLVGFGAGAALVAVPHGGEVLLVLCNIHFVLIVFILGEVMGPHPPGRLGAAAVVAAVLIATLSGPESAIALPFFGWCAWRARRSPRSLAVAAAAVAGGAIQAAVMLATGRGSGGPRGGWLHLLQDPPRVLPYYAQDFFARWAGLDPSLVLGGIVLAIALGLLGFVLVGQRNRFRGPALVLLALAALYLLAGRVAAPGWGNPFGPGARYVYIPFVLAFIAVVCLLGGAADRGRRLAAGALLVAAIGSSGTHWQSPTPQNCHWPDQVAEYRNHERKVFLMPDDWKVAAPVSK